MRLNDMTDTTKKAMTLEQVRDGLRGMKTFPHSLFNRWADAIDDHLSAQRDGDSPLEKLAAVMSGLELPPDAVNLPASQLEAIAKVVAEQAKEAAQREGEAAQVSVPEGWKLVPIKPTQKMLDAPHHMWQPEALNVWNAMLAAAPSQPRKPAHPRVEVTDAMAYRACKKDRVTRDEPSQNEITAMKRKIEAALSEKP
jgi:hypothetical protein